MAFDIVIEFHEAAVRDLQIRMLNLYPLTNLWLESPICRVVEQPVPPLQIKACWNGPALTIGDNCVVSSATVKGGARQASGRILTLDGEVSASGNLTVTTDANSRPYVRAEPPGPHRLGMGKLKVSHPESSWPSFLAGFDPAKEQTLLRPVLATQLFTPLASIPLTYAPASLPIALAPVGGEALPAALAVVAAQSASSSIALGLALTVTGVVPSTVDSLLPEQGGYNAAIGVSEHGMNALLGHLCRTGAAAGQLTHSQLGPIAWRWERIAVTLEHDGWIGLAGILVHAGTSTPVQAQLRCHVQADSQLQYTLAASCGDTIIDETVLACGVALLRRLFSVPATQEQGSRLWQHFDLPGTDRHVAAAAAELQVRDDQIVVYYTIPATPEPFPLEIPPPSPSATIVQPSIPTQAAPGAPVVIELNARITGESAPPYDYVWSTDLFSKPSPRHDSSLTIQAVPADPAGHGSPQVLTMAYLKVIDMFRAGDRGARPSQIHSGAARARARC